MLSTLQATCPAVRTQLLVRRCTSSLFRLYSLEANATLRNTISPLPQHGWNSEIGLMTKRIANEALKTPEEIWADRSAQAHSLMNQFPPANAYSGRSVPVSNRDLSGALNKLSTILTKNRVRQQLRQAERHEKRGDKRRRLSSERWRRRFSDEVRKKVQLVEQIRIRGA